MDNKDYIFKIFQKQGLSFMIYFDDKTNWENFYLTRIIKLTEDKNDSNTESKLNDTKQINITNFSNEDMNLIRSGVLPIRLSSDETDLTDTEYIFEVTITNQDNSVNYFTLQSILEIDFVYNKN